MRGTRRAVAAAVAGVAALGTTAAVAAPALARSSSPRVHVITSKLDGPWGLQANKHGFLVAQSDTGKVTRVMRGGKKQLVFGGVGGLAGVAGGNGAVFALTGGPNEDGSPPKGDFPPSSVVRSTYSGNKKTVIADLLKYELNHNPDGQKQFDADHKPYDALSNPFSMNYSRIGLLVADGGANDVLKVNPATGRISTYFVPRTVTDVKACRSPKAQANPGTKGCDPVPTGVSVTKRSVYISTLGAEVPGAGRVYRLSRSTGHVVRVWRGLTAPTGVTVSPRGTIFVSEGTHGAPEGPPPAGFKPSSVGRIIRIQHGHVTQAQVPTPIGLDFSGGHLYSTAWGLGSFVGVAHHGQIVRVDQAAFH